MVHLQLRPLASSPEDLKFAKRCYTNAVRVLVIDICDLRFTLRLGFGWWACRTICYLILGIWNFNCPAKPSNAIVVLEFTLTYPKRALDQAW